MSMSTKLRDQVSRALSELGGSAREIAAHLGQKKVVGRCGVPHDCPLANFLAKEFPSHRFFVNLARVLAYGKIDCEYDDRDFIFSVDLNKYHRKFLDLFDRKCYPFLIQREEGFAHA